MGGGGAADCFPERLMVVSKKVGSSLEATCTPPVRASSFPGWMFTRSREEPAADWSRSEGTNQGSAEAGVLRRCLVSPHLARDPRPGPTVAAGPPSPPGSSGLPAAQRLICCLEPGRESRLLDAFLPKRNRWIKLSKLLFPVCVCGA